MHSHRCSSDTQQWDASKDSDSMLVQAAHSDGNAASGLVVSIASTTNTKVSKRSKNIQDCIILACPVAVARASAQTTTGW
jgi:hypothetical protein